MIQTTSRLKKIIALSTTFCFAFALKVHAALPNPLGSINSPEDLIANVIQTILGLTGSVALFMFVYGGIMWLTSAGNQDRVSRGRQILVWATIGLVVIFSSYAILKEIFDTLQ